MCGVTVGYRNLDLCFQLFAPDLVIYNAGTDCLAGDPLGLLSISESGIIKRDEMVFRKVHENNCPVVMVTSGGYQMSNASIIAKSICNLLQLGLIEKLSDDSIKLTRPGNQSNTESRDHDKGKTGATGIVSPDQIGSDNEVHMQGE